MKERVETVWRNKREIADRLQSTPRTISDYMLKGMPFYRVTARKILFRDEDVDAWVAGRKAGGAA